MVELKAEEWRRYMHTGGRRHWQPDKGRRQSEWKTDGCKQLQTVRQI